MVRPLHGSFPRRIGWFVVVAALALLPGCSTSETDRGSSSADVASTDSPESESKLRLYVIDCGLLTVDDVSMFALAESDVETHDLFVPCYLVEHPEGRLLWDAGLPIDSLTGEREVAGGTVSLDMGLQDRLAEIGVTPSDVDFVAFSHLHWDHCGQGDLFVGSTHLIQRAEYEAAFADPPTVPFFEPELYQALEDAETVLLDGDHDVFGDGRVVIKSSPGHTPGHQTLFVDLEETGPILLSGDLYHFPANRTLTRPPTFNYDAEQTIASMKATEAFLEESGAQLWIEHDALLAATLRKSPEFYE